MASLIPTASAPVPTPITRRQIPVTYQSATTVPVKLNRTLAYRKLRLELTGQPTLTAANNTAANTGQGDEWAVCKLIQIAVNGSDQLRTFTGEQLWWLNWFWYGQSPRITATLADSATANPTFDSSLVIPFWKPRAFHPFDTALDSGRFNDMQLAVQWGAFTDVNSAASAWTANPVLNLLSEEQVLPQNPMDQPKLNWVSKSLVNIPAGANSSYIIPLDAGVSYDSFILNVKKADASADAGSVTYTSTPASLISSVKLVAAGGRVLWDGLWSDLVQTSRTEKSMPQTATRRSAQSSDQAWGMLDLCSDGRLTEAAFNPQDMHFEINVLGTCQITILPSQIFPLG